MMNWSAEAARDLLPMDVDLAAEIEQLYIDMIAPPHARGGKRLLFRDFFMLPLADRERYAREAGLLDDSEVYLDDYDETVPNFTGRDHDLAVLERAEMLGRLPQLRWLVPHQPYTLIDAMCDRSAFEIDKEILRAVSETTKCLLTI